MAGRDEESKAHPLNVTVYSPQPTRIQSHSHLPVFLFFFFSKHTNQHFKLHLGIFPSQFSPLFAKPFWTRQNEMYFLLGDCLVCRPVCVRVCAHCLAGR